MWILRWLTIVLPSLPLAWGEKLCKNISIFIRLRNQWQDKSLKGSSKSNWGKIWYTVQVAVDTDLRILFISYSTITGSRILLDDKVDTLGTVLSDMASSLEEFDFIRLHPMELKW